MEVRTTNSLNVLIAEANSDVQQALLLKLQKLPCQSTCCNDSKQVLDALTQQAFDLIVCDIDLLKSGCAEFIQQCRELRRESAVVVIGPKESALNIIRDGAYDYLNKPLEARDLELMLLKFEQQRNYEEPGLLRPIQRSSFANIIAKSPSMLSILDTVKRLSQFNTTVLITGESGTGKELIAQAIHHNSPRRGKPFVAINCGAIPETLMESELFGHKKGAFTDATRDKRGLFEEASGGTIFLDEIGELPLHLQVKLLRALQEQQIRPVGDSQPVAIDVRVIAATLRDLEADVERGRFRDDLYYRLNVVTIHIPALRERAEDIPVLIESFLAKQRKRHNLEVKGFSPEALKIMLDYSWRGNVRELENCIERSMVLAEGDIIEADALPQSIIDASQSQSHSTFRGIDDSNLSIKQMTRALECDLISRALKKTKNNRTHAAKLLEISHRALLYKLKEYGIE